MTVLRKTAPAPQATPAKAPGSKLLGAVAQVPVGELKLWDGNPRKMIDSAEDVALNSVKTWKANPRKNDEAVPRLAELLREHGQRSPLVVWRKNNVIYKGNTTYKAARFLGWDKIAVVYADFPSEQAAIAYGIADNKSSEWSDWDDNALSKLLKSDSDFFRRSNTGLQEKDLERLSSLGEPGDEDTGPEETEGDAKTYIVVRFPSVEARDRVMKVCGVDPSKREVVWAVLKARGLK